MMWAADGQTAWDVMAQAIALALLGVIAAAAALVVAILNYWRQKFDERHRKKDEHNGSVG